MNGKHHDSQRWPRVNCFSCFFESFSLTTELLALVSHPFALVYHSAPGSHERCSASHLPWAVWNCCQASCALLPSSQGLLHFSICMSGLRGWLLLPCLALPGQLKTSSLQWPSLPLPPQTSVFSASWNPSLPPGLAFFQDCRVAAVVLECPPPGADPASQLPGCSDWLQYLISDEYTQNYLPKTGHLGNKFQVLPCPKCLDSISTCNCLVWVLEKCSKWPSRVRRGALLSSALKRLPFTTLLLGRR